MRGLVADFAIERAQGFRLDMSLSVPAGTTVALLGPNGAGKSTAVAAIAGLLPVDRGHIDLDGRPLDGPDGFVPPEERRIGVVFQDQLLFPHLDVLENIAFGLRSTGVSRDEATGRARRWVERLDLIGMESRSPSELSGGQAQRVALARALVTDPALLLLDEPLSALDVTTRTELRHTLGEHLRAFEGPRVIITHDPTEAFLLADEVSIVEGGAISQSGTPDDIRLRPASRYVADLVGFNLVEGRARAGRVATVGHELTIADDDVSGPVLVTIHPTAVSVYANAPEGSPRNVWPTTVERVERLGGRVRLRVGAPLALTVEVTESSRVDLGLEPGAAIWVAVKATEIGVQPHRGM